MIAIEPSIQSADFARLGEQARDAETAGVEGLQVDVMDRHFVPSITFGPGVVRPLRSRVSVTPDAHLMIVEPERYLAGFVGAGADRLIVHQEGCLHPDRMLQSMHELGVEAAVAINAGTRLCVLEVLLDLTDLVQVMTLNPGFGGQTFIHSQVGKIGRLRQILDERELDIPNAANGGMNPTTAPFVVKAGARVLEAGSSICNDRASVADNIAALRASVSKSSKNSVPQ